MNQKIETASIPDIIERFRRGDTMQQIADSCGVTRAAIGKLLKKRGLTRRDGGFLGGAIPKGKREQRRAAVRRRVETRVFQTYGLPVWRIEEIVAKAKALNNKDPRKAFRYHCNCMRLIGVAWDMTFAEWWQLWERSGKWAQRGRGPGCYVMARKDCAKPITRENVCIILYEARRRRLAEKGHDKQSLLRKRPQGETAERQRAGAFRKTLREKVGRVDARNWGFSTSIGMVKNALQPQNRPAEPTARSPMSARALTSIAGSRTAHGSNGQEDVGRNLYG